MRIGTRRQYTWWPLLHDTERCPRLCAVSAGAHGHRKPDRLLRNLHSVSSCVAIFALPRLMAGIASGAGATDFAVASTLLPADDLCKDRALKLKRWSSSGIKMCECAEELTVRYSKSACADADIDRDLLVLPLKEESKISSFSSHPIDRLGCFDLEYCSEGISMSTV